MFGLPIGIVLGWLFILGAVIGSFLNVCIYRIPQQPRLWDALKGLYDPPSHCPRCQTHISFRDNVPIIGWLKLRGRCRYCRGRISFRYPLIEAMNGLLFAVVYWFEVPHEWGASILDSCVYSPMGPTEIPRSFWFSETAIVHWRYFYHMVLLESLVVASLIDFDLRIIPDASTLPAMAVGVVGAFALGRVYLVPVWFQEPQLLSPFQDLLPAWTHFALTAERVPAWVGNYPHFHGLMVSLVGLIVGGGTVWAVRIIGFRILRQEAMGFGDVILMAVIGSFLGWQPTVVVFFLAPVCALAAVAACWIFRKHREIPYGPYLSLATLLVILGWQTIWPIAERVFSLGPVLLFVVLLMTVFLVLTLQLVQGIKRLMGIPLYPQLWSDEWTSADQLAHFSGETVDEYFGRWRTEEWPGRDSGRGVQFDNIWKDGHSESNG